MSLKKDGTIIILSSPSGAGKTTLANLLSHKLDYYISVSHTTREPRANEIHGQHYYFTNKKNFEQLIKKNKFLEHAQVFKNLYGTSKEIVFDKLSNGKNVIFDIDWQGAEQIRKKKLKI